MLVCSCGSTDLTYLYNDNNTPKQKLQCDECKSIITTKTHLTCNNCNSKNIAKDITTKTLSCRDCKANVTPKNSVLELDNVTDSDVVACNIETNRKNQKLVDNLRMLRKSNREENRNENILEDYFSSIENNIRNLKPETIYHVETKYSCDMIVQLSDLHFNSVINLKSNKYNFEIASQRLYKYAQKICNYLKNGNFTNVYVVMTGDLINSDSRMDKQIQNATSNGNATIIGYQIISQFIGMINKYANVIVTAVSGNESRLSLEKRFTDITQSNNMDFTLYYFLKLHFENCKGISFIDPKGYEQVLNIKNLNIVILHGDNNKKHSKTDIDRCVTSFSIGDRIIPDLILCGHLHSTQIGDIWCRSGSLCGTDYYAKNGLQLYGKASQNIFIIYSNQDIDSIRIDLQKINENDLKFNYEKHLETWENYEN